MLSLETIWFVQPLSNNLYFLALLQVAKQKVVKTCFSWAWLPLAAWAWTLIYCCCCFCPIFCTPFPCDQIVCRLYIECQAWTSNTFLDAWTFCSMVDTFSFQHLFLAFLSFHSNSSFPYSLRSSSLVFGLECFFRMLLLSTCSSFLLSIKWFINLYKEIVVKSLESSKEEILGSYLLGSVVMTFSTILLPLNWSPSNLMLLTIAIILSEHCLTVSASFILKISKSLIRLMSCCCLVFSKPWNSSFSLSQAYLWVSQAMILVKITSETPFCRQDIALYFLSHSSLCCLIWAMVGFALKGGGSLSISTISHKS